MKTLLLAALLCSVPALAEIYTSDDDFHFSLARRTMTGATDGDLHISSIGVFAQYGARRLSRAGGFQVHEVLVLGEAYDVKDAAGATWQMWIRMSRNRTIEVELNEQRPEARVAGATEKFRAVSITIDGAEAAPTFAPLELAADGKYRLGTANGRFERDDAGLSLDGVPAQWGRGALSLSGEALTFRFLRGSVRWEVKYERATQTDAVAAR